MPDGDGPLTNESQDDIASFRGLHPGWYRDPANHELARYWDGTTLSQERRLVAEKAHSFVPAPPSTPTLEANAASQVGDRDDNENEEDPGDLSRADQPQGPDWWQATDGKWYPPFLHPGYQGSQGAQIPETDSSGLTGSDAWGTPGLAQPSPSDAELSVGQTGDRHTQEDNPGATMQHSLTTGTPDATPPHHGGPGIPQAPSWGNGGAMSSFGSSPMPRPNLPRHRTYGGASAVSVIFKAASLLVLIGGGISAYETARALHNHGDSSGTVTGIVIGIIAGTIITAASLAFFAYVLDLLKGIESNTLSNGLLGGLTAASSQGLVTPTTPLSGVSRAPAYPEPSLLSAGSAPQ